ncbi:unnamed protein product [Sphagnum compactum]
MGSIGPCHRCGRSGHLARHCSLHTCFRCNGRGHMAWECVEGVTCSRCGERGHLQRNCRNVSCHKCKRKGHIAKFCDDPFAKAADAERREQQQAFLAARAAGIKTSTSGEQGGSLETGSIPARGVGPWDGLGVTGLTSKNEQDQKENTRHEIKALKLRQQSPIEGVQQQSGFSSVGLKVFGVKRKGSSICEKSRLLKPKLPCHDMGNKEKGLDTFIERTSEVPEMSTLVVEPLQKPVEVVVEPERWHGLVGYGSEDSDTEVALCCWSSGCQSEEEDLRVGSVR